MRRKSEKPSTEALNLMNQNREREKAELVNTVFIYF